MRLRGFWASLSKMPSLETALLRANVVVRILYSDALQKEKLVHVYVCLQAHSNTDRLNQNANKQVTLRSALLTLLVLPV